MMTELNTMLGFKPKHSSPFYPQANGSVEAINKKLKSMLQRIINKSRSNWHIMVYLALWAYRTTIKTATSFSPFQLVHEFEPILPIECKIPSLKLAIHIFPETSSLEEFLIHLKHIDEQ